MDGEEQQKRVEQLSTASLDSLYDQNDESIETTKRPICNRCTWTPFMVLTGLILLAVGLVLALDRSNPDQQEAVVSSFHGDPILTALMSSRGLDAPGKKLMEWFEEARNASELYVAGGSSNMSVSGAVFPQNSRDTLLPYNAVVAINSKGVLSRRQFIVQANGRGFKWVVTSFGYGDIIATSGCLTSSHSLPLNELSSIMSTAKWTTSDIDDQNKVSVVSDEVTYTVSKDEDDYYSSETVDDQCWTIESEDEEFRLHVCTSVVGEELPQEELADLFGATTTCPQLAPMATYAMLSAPLPLRKWYASYQA
ncbi:unnamed protein product [Peronospora belbahrii]|uniref:Uncharacterized protein n=1 Tax=Peronospora belbahrii TaxID=622444 RepID=A0AAU9LAM2_9STRA|nr:unnamed protein product [Peronospora belbahrii]CAH0521703.1 unnamed protein product [Peronospora belbahrii]